MKPVRYTQEMADRWIREGFWGNPTVSDLWDRNAELYPDREVVVDSRQRITWSEAKGIIDRMALGLLAQGLRKDDVVAIQLPNSAEGLLLRVAVFKAGLISLTILMFYRESELLYALSQTETSAIVTCGEYRGVDYSSMLEGIRPQLPHLRHHLVVSDQNQQNVPGSMSLQELMETPWETQYPADYLRRNGFVPGDVTQLSLSSGTTGVPKLIQDLEDSRWGSSFGCAQRWRCTTDDVMLAMAPIGGGPSGGPCCYVAPHVGAKVVLMERFEPEEALSLIERERVTIATGVPAQWTMMVKHPNLGKYDLSSLRIAYYAGSVCPPALAQEIEEKTGGRVLSRYGMVDAGSLASTCYDDPPEVRWYAVGKPLENMEVRLVDDADRTVPEGAVGEVIVRGPGCHPGFHHDLERTMQAWGETDGWYHTGDLGKFDDHGNLYLVGRKKDVIFRGGQNIYPVEIESLLLQHPKIANVAVVAMPDHVMGEKTCAFVIPKREAELGFAEMVAFLRGKQIAPYKLPERLEIVDSLPMGSDGQKVLKNVLTEAVTAKLKAEQEASNELSQNGV